MPQPVLIEDDKCFLQQWRPHQTIPCLAQAIGTSYEVVDSYCRYHHLDGPHGRMAWLSQDKRVGHQNPPRPRKSNAAMSTEDAAFLRQWRPQQSLGDLAAAIEQPINKVRWWCKRAHLRGPLRFTLTEAMEQNVRAELAELAEGDRAFVLAERPHAYLRELAAVLGYSKVTVRRVCHAAGVRGPEKRKKDHPYSGSYHRWRTE